MNGPDPSPLGLARLKAWLRERHPLAHTQLRELSRALPLWVGPRGRRLRRELDAQASPSAVFDFAARHLPAVQIRSEILDLVTFARGRRPEVFVEIGTANGGTHFLLRHLCETLKASVAIDIDIHNRYLLEWLAPLQETHYIQGRSDDPAVRSRLARILGGRGVDLLFVDGDHRYDGVRRDVESYLPLVRSGGMVVLHDIVEDHGQRHGVATNKFTGGVPRLYRELAPRFDHVEFVSDPDQDGFGIGVLLP